MKIKIGQIWRDWDCRFRHSDPRLLKVIGFPNDLIVEVQNIHSGRKSLITKHRMQPTSTGYKLFEDIEDE